MGSCVKGAVVLSLVVITHNEADRLGRCLDSVPFAAEKVVLDCGSTDGTPDVARRHGARVVCTDWPGFVVQKNRALAAVNQPWALCLDADEWLEVEAAQAIERFLRDPGPWVGFSQARCSRWAGRALRHGRAYPDRQVRGVKVGWGSWCGGAVHERLEIAGKVCALDGDIGHDPYRSVSEHLRTIERYSELAAGELAASGRQGRKRDVLLRPSLRFVDSYVLRAGFLDGGPGLAMAGLGALYTGMKWGKLWQQSRSASPWS